MALIRYPGSKEKLAPQIIEAFPDEMRHSLWAHAAKWEYREPFFGAGAIGFRVLRVLPKASRVWINDKDYGIACLWQSVLHEPFDLCCKIAMFEPSTGAFFRFKDEDGDTSIPTLEAGFRKLALHQTTPSGLGCKSGGPLGGRDQSNARYPVDCRWNPERLKKHVGDCHKILKRFDGMRITNCDFADVLRGTTEKTFVYLDPPYVEKGGILYKHSMSEGDHRRLARHVNRLKCPWVVSYDDHPLVRELYGKHAIESVNITYTTAIARDPKRPKNRELVIYPQSNEVPA